MYYVYVLLSKRDSQFYTGLTNNLKRRITEHKYGKVLATAHKGPIRPIYCEICLDWKDAKAREDYLKSGPGRKYIKNRLKNFLLKQN